MAKAVPKKAPATKAAKPVVKKAANKVAAAKAPAAKAAAVKAPAAKASAAKVAPAKKEVAAKKAPAPKPIPADAKQIVKKATPAKVATAAKKAPDDNNKAPARTVTPYDAKFLEAQRKLLLDERAKLVGEAENLEAEAASLMEDLEPGDVQFDDESGEGDTLVVERERDLALSAQARQMVNDIDAALIRIEGNTYGLSLVSGRPIPKERLRAIPWATELVEEKVGGLGARR
jgi:RNA polymerase-binding transcription factor DksA